MDRALCLLAVLGLACWLGLMGGPLAAQQPLAEVTVLATGLRQPVGLVMRPRVGGTAVELLVADGEAGKVVRWTDSESDKLVDVVVGLNSGPSAASTGVAGPAGMVFLSRNTLVVAASSSEGGRLVSFDLDAAWPISATQAKLTKGVVADSIPQEAGPLSSLWSIARAGDFLYISSPDQHGVLLRSRVRATQIGPLEWLAGGNAAGPLAGLQVVATSDKGYLLAGSSNKTAPTSSQLVFLNPEAPAEPARLALAIPLHHLSALAFSPATKSLYATSVSVDEPTAGGVFRLSSQWDHQQRKQATTCERVASLAHPVGLLIDDDGTMYVADQGGGSGQGSLVRLSGTW